MKCDRAGASCRCLAQTTEQRHAPNGDACTISGLNLQLQPIVAHERRLPRSGMLLTMTPASYSLVMTIAVLEEEESFAVGRRWRSTMDVGRREQGFGGG